MKAIIFYSILILAMVIFLNSFLSSKDIAILKQEKGLIENRIDDIKKAFDHIK